MTESSGIVKTTAESGLAHVKEGVSTVVDQSAAKVKKSNLNTLRTVLRAGRFGGVTNNTYQTLPRPLALGCMMIGGGYALYKIMPGPLSVTCESNLTVNRNSSPLSLATYHFVHTDIATTAINMAVLATFGKYHWTALGPRSFLTLAACGAIAGSLATGNAVANDATYTASGGYAISGAFLTYHAFKTPMLYR